MAGAHLPEEIIVEILSRQPVKSLIRFSSVSKRWRFIILFDPDFAKSQFKASSKHKTLGHRLLVPQRYTTELVESLDLETPPFGDVSMARKMNIPFQRPGCSVSLLGSCNGLVFVYLRDHHHFYVWNPSNGFFKELPDPGFSKYVDIWYAKVNSYGIGYLPATDDYKVVVTTHKLLVMDSSTVAAIRTCKGPAGLIKIEHKEEEKHCLYIREDIWSHEIIEYEESLFWISGCNGVENPSQGCTKLK